jgi:hypothetical protein
MVKNFLLVLAVPRRSAGALNLRFESTPAASVGHAQNLSATHASCRKGGPITTTPGAGQLEPGNYSTVLARQSRSNCGRIFEDHWITFANATTGSRFRTSWLSFLNARAVSNQEFG